jgi:hypothetical protein
MSFNPIPGYEPVAPYGDVAPPDPAVDPSGSPSAQAPQPAPAQTPPFVMPVTPAPGPAPLAPLPVAPPPTPDPSASTRAGTAIVLVGAGLDAGALLGGLWGAGSGLLFSGALINAWRARTLWASTAPTDRSEAIKTTVMSIVGIAAGGYLGYKANAKRKDDDG